MSKKTGTLIRNARTQAGLTQAQLAKKVDGCSAADIGKAERGEKDLTQAQLKQIAKATGVTQSSLLESAKGSKTAKASKTAKTSSAKKTSSSQTFKLTSKEKDLIKKYRSAGAAKQAIVNMILDASPDTGSSSAKKDDLIGNILNMFGKKD